MKKIGIFGGTFNPIHQGHIQSIRSVLEKLSLDEIWVIPAFQAPLRSVVERPTPAQRLEMVQLALKGLSKVRVCDEEVNRKETSYTVDTILSFRAKQPKDRFFLIIGLDQFEQLQHWRSIDAILSEVDLVVTSRPGLALNDAFSPVPKWMHGIVNSEGDVGNVSHRVAQVDHDSQIPQKHLTTGRCIFFVQLEDIDISAHDLRRKLFLGKNINEYLPEPVAHYIHEHQLYLVAGPKIGDFFSFTRKVAGLLNEKKALNIRGFDLRNRDAIAEFTLVASAISPRHSRALAENIRDMVKSETGALPLHMEGLIEGRWVVLDYGALIVHIFYDFARQEYCLEELWDAGVEMSLKLHAIHR